MSEAEDRAREKFAIVIDNSERNPDKPYDLHCRVKDGRHLFVADFEEKFMAEERAKELNESVASYGESEYRRGQADERERCAKIVDATDYSSSVSDTLSKLAAAIRSSAKPAEKGNGEC